MTFERDYGSLIFLMQLGDRYMTTFSKENEKDLLVKRTSALDCTSAAVPHTEGMSQADREHGGARREEGRSKMLSKRKKAVLVEKPYDETFLATLPSVLSDLLRRLPGPDLYQGT